MADSDAVKAAKAEGILPLARLLLGLPRNDAPPLEPELPGMNPDGWTIQARVAVHTGFLDQPGLPSGAGTPVLLPAESYLIYPETVRACGGGDLAAGAAALQDRIMSTAELYLRAAGRAGMPMPTHYFPATVAHGTFFVHPFEVIAIGAGDAAQGLVLLGEFVLSIPLPP